jgi:hypothetical protein
MSTFKLGPLTVAVIGLGMIVLMLAELTYFFIGIPSLFYQNRIDNKEHVSNASQKCSSESVIVNGTEFSLVWPKYTNDVWDLVDNITDGTEISVWLPSNFSQLCAAGVNLSTSIHAPPLYHNKDRPSGLRLVMLGDSVTRYQFVMLIHYLHTGHWIHDSMQPNLLREDTFGGGGWTAFYNAFETYFEHDHMVCDCFRGTIWEKQLHENQFYLNRGCLDNSVTFFAKFGGFGFRGYHTAADINGWFHNSTGTNNGTKLLIPQTVYEQGNYTWIYHTYDPFLRNVVAMLEPRPRVVVINEGLWTDTNLSDETVVRMIRDTISDLGMVSVYRTTTKRCTSQGENVAGLLPHDKLCCEIFDYCLKMDWTACAAKGDYWDSMHFLAHANLRFVEQLLDLQGQLGNFGEQIHFTGSPVG